MLSLGFTPLPCILWRKQTNAPNKFMGSGMLPPGAYVTLEHEYILIFRKGNKRLFTTPAEKAIRRQSAFFWEERNQWFSDVWMGLKGSRQGMGDKTLRQRSAAFPFELAYRLICMFSVMGDTVLDPFLGTGTTLVAAACAARNSLGYELDDTLFSTISRECRNLSQIAKRRIDNRFDDHLTFIKARKASGKPVKYINKVYGFPVVTRQEIELLIVRPESFEETAPGHFQVSYEQRQLQMTDGAATISTYAKSER
jgi:DNA modification methylase